MKALYRLAAPVLVCGMVALFGPISIILLLGCAMVVMLAPIQLHYKARHLGRKGCDDMIFYARKKRHALGEPDYTEGELAEMKALRKKGDFRPVSALISASDKRLRDKRQAEQQQAMAEAKKAASAMRQRDEDLRMYRA